MLSGDRLQIAVIVGVLKAALQRIVVYIGNAEFRFYAGNAHGLKFQIGHGSGCILGQCLVNPKGNFRPGFHLTRYQMGCDYFLCNGFTHDSQSP